MDMSAALERLAAYPNWVVGDKDKVPYNPNTGRPAKANDPQTWGTYEQAEAFLKTHKKNGFRTLGFEVGNSPFTAVDLDNCRVVGCGEIDDWAEGIVDTIKSYTEISPSGTGLRIFVLTRNDIPPINRKRGGLGDDGKGAIEIANTGKYFSVTGNHYWSSPDVITNNTKGLQKVIDKYFPAKPEAEPVATPKQAGNLEDAEIIQKASNARNGPAFRKLCEGDWSDYPSRSEADMAFCSMLVFWCGGDVDQIDRIFRSSGLMRAKWEREGYRQATLTRAIEGMTEVYRPPILQANQEVAMPNRPVPPEMERTADTPTTETQVPPGPDENSDLLEFNLTDAGNAESFARRYEGRYLFVPEKKAWLRFDGQRYSEDDQAVLSMLETMRAKMRQALDSRGSDLDQNGDRGKNVTKWCFASESRMRLGAALTLAEPMMSKSLTEFDKNPWHLCCENGVLDLRSGQLLAPTKNDYFTKTAGIIYDPTAGAPRWLKFLGEVFDRDEDLINFVQKAVGYSLTGLTTEQVLFILYGTGANGKSVFLNIIGDLLGDYSLTAPSSTFKDTPYDNIPNDIARMAGARLVKTLEIREGTRLNEDRVKALTGGDRIAARYLHCEFFEFNPMCKFWISVNHKPVIRGTDEAIWRRIRLIPFERYFSPEARDPNLHESLKKELSGILRWAVEGCLGWQREGLTPAGKVGTYTAEYRSESDLVGQFLDDCTKRTLTGKVETIALYRRYEEWTKGHGEYCISGTTFAKRIQEKGITKKKSNGMRYYLGLELTQ